MNIKNECYKCKKKTNAYCSIVEAGTVFKFCQECSDVICTMPTGNTIHNLLGKEPESWVTRNMREARERRASGERLWT